MQQILRTHASCHSPISKDEISTVTMSDEDGTNSDERAERQQEHLNIKVSDNNNNNNNNTEIVFKVKRNTKLEKLMNAFCERQGKSPSSVRFLFEGSRVQPTETPDDVCPKSVP